MIHLSRHSLLRCYLQSGTEVCWPVGGIMFIDPRGFSVQQLLATPSFTAMRQPPAEPAGHGEQGKRRRGPLKAPSPKKSKTGKPAQTG